MSRKKALVVSVERAGQMLGLSRGSSYRAVANGEIPSLRFGRRLVVPVVQLRALLAGQRDEEADAR